MRILIVDDEVNIRRTLSTALETMGHATEEASSGASALRRIEQHPCDAALVDLRLGQESGIDLIEQLRGSRPQLVIVVITAYASIETAVEAIRRGAAGYLPKPFTPHQLRAALDKAWQRREPRDSVPLRKETHRGALPEAELESHDPLIRRVIDQARMVAPTDAVVLIRGESGTGKGVLAQAMHAWGRQAGGPFVTVVCPSLSPELLESDLFGHVRGAFTGAVRDAVGKVAAAEGGTLFLDEVGDLSPRLQPKLLRFLQERKYERIGEAVTRSSGVRLIAATNRDLEAKVASGQFREDLFYRLNTVELTMPPLRERTDILVLADHLLAHFARQSGRRLDGFTAEAREALTSHRWPGNLREMRNIIERAVILAEGRLIGLADLPDRLARRGEAVQGTSTRRITLEQLEREHIHHILAETQSLDEAAQVLGIDRSTLYRKRKRLGL